MTFFFVPSSTAATTPVNDAGADTTADAADAGDHQGQHDAGHDHPHPPAGPALPLTTATGSNVVSTLVLAGAGSSPETIKEFSHSFLCFFISSSSIILQ